MTTPLNILRPKEKSQEPLEQQLVKAIVIARHQGLYEAADWIQDVLDRRRKNYW